MILHFKAVKNLKEMTFWPDLKQRDIRGVEKRVLHLFFLIQFRSKDMTCLKDGNCFYMKTEMLYLFIFFPHFASSIYFSLTKRDILSFSWYQQCLEGILMVSGTAGQIIFSLMKN